MGSSKISTYLLLIVFHFLIPGFFYIVWVISIGKITHLIQFIWVLVTTTALFGVYIFFDQKRSIVNLNHDLLLLAKIFTEELTETKRSYLQIDLDLFIIALSLSIPNGFFVLSLILLGNISVYFLSIISSTMLIIVALYLIYENYKEAAHLKHQLLEKTINLFENNKELAPLLIYKLVSDYKIFIYPKINIFLLFIGSLSTFVLPFIPK